VIGVVRASAPIVCAAALTALVGCGDSTAGTPVSADQRSAEPPSTARPETTSDAPDYSLAHLCELLASDEAQRLGGSAEGEEGNSISDGHAQCTWSGDTSLVVGVQPGLRTTSVRTGPGITNTPTTVDGLTAVQSRETDPIVICQVLIDLPDGNLFGTSAALLTGGEGEYEPCTLANELAKIIVPRVKNQ